MRTPTDFKMFLCNDDNKTQLFKLLLEVVKSEPAAPKIIQCDEALFVVEGKVFKITVGTVLIMDSWKRMKFLQFTPIKKRLTLELLFTLSIPLHFDNNLLL